jgi:hypothetical protein
MNQNDLKNYVLSLIFLNSILSVSVHALSVEVPCGKDHFLESCDSVKKGGKDSVTGINFDGIENVLKRKVSEYITDYRQGKVKVYENGKQIGVESAGLKPICSVVPLSFAAGSESACVADAKQLQDQTSCGELAGAFPNQGGLPRSIITKSDFSGREFVHSLGSVMVALAHHTNAVISNLGSGIALTVDEKGGCLAAAKATADVIKKFNSDELKNRDHWKKQCGTNQETTCASGKYIESAYQAIVSAFTQLAYCEVQDKSQREARQSLLPTGNYRNEWLKLAHQKMNECQSQSGFDFKRTQSCYESGYEAFMKQQMLNKWPKANQGCGE